MEEISSFENFLSVSSAEIPISLFAINLILTAIVSTALSLVYVRYGSALSNRKYFSKNFILIAMTTMLIITIVKSSLALSLGLVGALSIVRFRGAIKEPEELAYLFLAISIGLGFGANQAYITLVAFFMIIAIIILVKRFSERDEDNSNLYLTISSNKNISIECIIDILKKHSTSVSLKRIDESGDVLEVSFLLFVDNYNELIRAKNSLKELDENMNISYLDQHGLSYG